MEFYINRDIREYEEKFFMGLNMRQCVCMVLTVVLSIMIHFMFSDCSSETRSWIITVSAVPLVLTGFKKIKGMYPEAFVKAWFKQTFMMPRELVFGNDDYIQDILKEEIQKHEERKSKD